jgi:hypothetical protein
MRANKNAKYFVLVRIELFSDSMRKKTAGEVDVLITQEMWLNFLQTLNATKFFVKTLTKHRFGAFLSTSNKLCFGSFLFTTNELITSE